MSRGLDSMAAMVSARHRALVWSPRSGGHVRPGRRRRSGRLRLDRLGNR